MKKTGKKPASKSKAKTPRVQAKKAVPKISKTPEDVAEQQLQDRQYIYERFVQLYMHSKHARHSFKWLVLFTKTRTPSAIAVIPDESEVDDEYENAHTRHWLHKPYPYSGATRFVAVAIGLASLSVLIQIMYPSGRTLPLSHLEGNGFTGLKTQQQIEQKISSINNSNLTVTTRNSSVNTSYSAMGVRANADQTFKSLSDYPFEKRLIPFSMVYESIKPTRVSREVNVEKLMGFAQSVLTVTYKAPKDASIGLQNNRLIVSPSEEGYQYDEASLQRQLAQSKLGREEVKLEPTVIAPQIPTQAAQASVADMQKRIDAGLTVSAADQNVRIASDTIASWIIIEQKPELKTINLTFDKNKVTESLKPLVTAVDLQGVPEQITLLNGVQAGIKQGKPGRVLDFDDLVNQVTGATSWTVGLIQAKVDNQGTQKIYSRTYTRDSIGFQSLINYWVSNTKGRVAVELRSQNGRIQANANQHQLFNGAHKLYIPHLTYGRISTRTVNPGTTTSTGFTVDGCIDKVVVSSNDACTNVLGDIVGWGGTNSLLASQGFLDTRLTQGGGSTSAHDGAEWGIKLLDNNLTTVAQKSALISMMGAQNMRSGIPAGATGVGVANRAVQAGNVRYDVGIIFHGRGTYVLSVFTENASFADIAGLAGEINTVMGQ